MACLPQCHDDCPTTCYMHVEARCQQCFWRASGESLQMEAEARKHEFMARHDGVIFAPTVRSSATDTVVTDPETGGRKGAKLAQFSQIPADVLWELAEHYGKGLAKYPDAKDGEPNWQRGYSWRLSVDAMLRHISQFLMGEDVDPDNGSSHLIAAAWHLFALRWFQLHGKGRDFR